MGNRNSGGRNRKSTALKLLRGNPGKGPLNLLEPGPPPGQVTKPSWLSAGACLIWDQMAPLCVAMRTLTVVDEKAFGCFCELQFSLERGAAMKRMGDWDEAMRVERHYAPLIRPYYDYFGLTPTSRARMAVAKADDGPVKKWANLK
jgi:phage terminase small subunit